MSDDRIAQSGATGPSDEELLAAIGSARDRAAFAEVFRRYAGKLKAFLMRSGSPHEEAEEAAQEVMVAIWRRADSFDPEKAGAATWIYTIARNKRVDMLRRRDRPEPDPHDPIFQPEPTAPAEAQLSGSERDARVRAALGTLSDDQLAVVRLAFFSGMSHNEIAETLDAPLGTVKSRLRLSFAHLRSSLGEEFALELFDD